MVLVPGARFGAYEIAAQLGAGGHGRSLARPRRPAGAGRGPQAGGGGLRRRPRAPGPLRARGEAHGRLPSPEHRRALRPGGVRGPTRARAGARRGADARRAARDRSDPAAGSARHRPPGGRGARARARARHHPPRPQAREHQADPGGPGEGPRLRAGPAPRRGVEPGRRAAELAHAVAVGDAGGSDPGDRALHVARAGAGAGRGSWQRHLVVRRDPVRDADRRAAVPGGDSLGRARVRAADRGRVGSASRRRRRPRRAGSCAAVWNAIPASGCTTSRTSGSRSRRRSASSRARRSPWMPGGPPGRRSFHGGSPPWRSRQQRSR